MYETVGDAVAQTAGQYLLTLVIEVVQGFEIAVFNQCLGSLWLLCRRAQISGISRLMS